MYKIINKDSFYEIQKSDIAQIDKLKIISEMCRYNTLVAVKNAGSGHLGSSYSALDILTYLYYAKMNITSEGLDSNHRDVFFSSKGHDVPGLYSILHSLGILTQNQLMKLRRLDGLDGHPEVHIPGIEANSGSLGMGISKGKGIAWAKTYLNYRGHVYVLIGDGELQEGQIYEAMQTVAHQKISNLTVIVDHNKYQTDKKVNDIISIQSLKKKFEAFGWYYDEFDGHNYEQIEEAFLKSEKIKTVPKILVANTIKGKGVKLFEPDENEKLYQWHSGAPNEEFFEEGCKELLDKIEKLNNDFNLKSLIIDEINLNKKNSSNVSNEYVIDGYESELIRIGKRRNDVIIIDGDLAADCRVRKFENKFPDRFIENGIAEQDMVSMAGGLASQGLLPIVNSFASFLSSRPNEQIYNNATEKNKIIYAFHFAGIIPAGPGKSHQSIRDIALLSSLPNSTIFQPSNSREASLGLRYFVDDEEGVCILRMNIGPSPRIIKCPDKYRLKKGQGYILKDGQDIAIIAYGPVLLSEALLAREILENNSISAMVINMPWINCADHNWLNEQINKTKINFILDDHSVVGGLGDHIISSNQTEKQFKKIGLNTFPKCGNPAEVLKSHKLDGRSIAKTIASQLDRNIDLGNDFDTKSYLDNAPQ